MKHIVHELKLKNGAKGLLIHVPEATVFHSSFHFLAGNRFVTNKTIEQTAHLMEHMAFGASEMYRDADTFDAEFTKNGAYHNAYTSDFSMQYIADYADFEWDRILQLQTLSITKPLFLRKYLVAEAGNVRNELTGYVNSRGRVLWYRMRQAMGVDTMSDKESLETIDKVTLDDIAEHHKRTHTLKNMRFVIAGNITPERKSHIAELIESWTLPTGERFAIPHDTISGTKPFFVPRKEDTNLLFELNFQLPQRLDQKQLDAMGALNHILTGTLHSRIQGAARKKGLAYGIWSGAEADEYDSEWTFSAQVNLETVEEVFDIIVLELKRIKAGTLDEQELEEAKQYALGKQQMGAQTVGSIANWYASDYFFDESIHDFMHRPDEITSITKEQVLETAHLFFKKPTWSLGGIGKGNQKLMQTLNKKIEDIL